MSALALRSSALFLCLAGIAYPQSPFTCATFAVNPIVRAEGIAEPLGDIAISCSGGAPGSVISFNLGILFSSNQISCSTGSRIPAQS